LLADGRREEEQRRERPPREAPRGRDGSGLPPRPHEGADGAQGERCPREEASREDRQVEPPGPRIVEAGGGEPLEVVADEEPAQVVVAVGHQERHREHDGCTAPDRPGTLAPQDRRHDQRHEHDGDGSLGEHAQPGRRSRGHPPGRRPRAGIERGPQRGIDGEAHERREREIRERQARDREVAEAGRHDRAADTRRGLVVPAAADGCRQQGQRKGGERRPDARGRLGNAGDAIGAGDEPVGQDRLLKAGLVTVVWSEPVAAREHLAARLRVEGLVGVADRRPAEAREERGPAEDQQQGSRSAHGAELYLNRRDAPGTEERGCPSAWR
jgi:hypothetical protein